MEMHEYFFILVALVAILAFSFTFLRRRRQNRKHAIHRKAILMDILRKAQEQNETLDIKLLDEGDAKHGLSALMRVVEDDRLEVEVLEYVSSEWIEANIDVYFRVTLPEGPIFYKFRSTVKNIKAQGKKSHITLTPPRDLEVGQKRNFIRIRPPSDSVRAVAVWHLDPTRPMPRTTSEVGPPLIHYRQGMLDAPVVLENISSTGVALRFSIEDPANPPDKLKKGSQLLCLIIYCTSDNNEQTNVFWTTNEIVNSRVEPDPPPTLVIGSTFTNWAMLEQGSTEIHWFHSSPTRGVMPITQWVMQIDRKQHLLT
ncbi:MAG: hypothetical protein LBR31_08975 [Desulfovibrio sp.]|jgi:hypothetical protein|nr:hypothetical protein [Desulfovibrio sp.]